MNPYENAYAQKRGFPFAVVAVFLILIALGLAGVSVYLFTEKETTKAAVEIRANEAAEAASLEQLAKDQQEFDAYVAQTTKPFESNSDFGAIKFEYPEEWSAYNDINGSSSGSKDVTTYTAYFSPGVIAPVTEDHVYPHALEIKIYKATFDSIRAEYKKSIEDGLVSIEDYVLANEHALREDPAGIKGQKITGFIYYKNEIVQGTIIQFAVRDKVLQLYNTQPAYADAFYNTVLRTLRWTK
jgi:hypothetical protein